MPKNRHVFRVLESDVCLLPKWAGQREYARSSPLVVVVREAALSECARCSASVLSSSGVRVPRVNWFYPGTSSEAGGVEILGA